MPSATSCSCAARFPATARVSCAFASRRTRPTARYNRKDAFYQRAKAEGYRGRAAYKLRDLLKRAPAVKKGSAVVELGCWPGSWLQVLVQVVGSGGRIVGVDRDEIEPLEGVTFLALDFTEPGAPEQIAAALGQPADALLCDAAPKLSGIKDVDRAAQEEIYEGALRVADRVLRKGGTFILKGFPGPESDRMRKLLRKRSTQLTELRPEAKRPTSKEFYWICRLG